MEVGKRIFGERSFGELELWGTLSKHPSPSPSPITEAPVGSHRPPMLLCYRNWGPEPPIMATLSYSYQIRVGYQEVEDV